LVVGDKQACRQWPARPFGTAVARSMGELWLFDSSDWPVPDSGILTLIKE
jgi:hypothetical protein